MSSTAIWRHLHPSIEEQWDTLADLRACTVLKISVFQLTSNCKSDLLRQVENQLESKRTLERDWDEALKN